MILATPKIYYGLHFAEGVAEYAGSEDRIFINEDTIRKMNSTFSGRPVFVGHKDLSETDIQKEADGYVSESFYNKADGKSWVKFIVLTEEGEAAIQRGWRLSNGYIVLKQGEGGKWHNIDYAYEVLDAEYNHLAIVETPRYDESIILTPDQFKVYNEKKEAELIALENSVKKEVTKTNNIKGSKSMLKFFKKTKVENADEIANAEIVLNSGESVSIEELVKRNNEYDEKEKEEKDNSDDDDKDEKDDKSNEADDKDDKEEKDNMIEVDGKEISEKDLVANYKKMKKNEDDAKEKDEKDNKKNEDEKEENLNEIKNAMNKVIDSEHGVHLSFDKVQRGKDLYSFNK